jgi:hypothetical protein
VRYANLGKRDANEPDVFKALEKAGCEPFRLTDIDIVAKDALGVGQMIEVKVPGQELSLTPIQKKLAAMFGERYHVVSSAEAALKAMGRLK